MVNSRTKLCQIFDKIPTRLNIAVLLFLACFFSYMLRGIMSITVLAMVQQFDENGTQIEMPDYGPRYPWTAFEQSLLLGSYFWGYTITLIPMSIVCEKYGGKSVITITFGACVVMTALIPVLAQFTFWISFVLRFTIGFVAGGQYPALHKIMSKWAPFNDKGKFSAALLGGSVGTVCTWPLAAILIETIGWDYAFYVPAIFVAILVICWHFFIYDTPAEHPRILEKEKVFIEESLVGITRTQTWPPFMRMIKSIPFWALFFLHYGNLWGLYFQLTAAPRYMNEILGFNLSEAGALASLPYLVRFFAGAAFGIVCDYIKRKRYLSVTNMRKTFVIFSHIIPGLFLIAMPYVSDQPFVYVTMITLSMGFNGATTQTNLQNQHDLAPNYAATVYGIISTAGTTAGFITPLVVAYFTRERNTADEWSIIFIIGAVAYILPGIFFIFFGSGSIQKWNEIPVKSEKDKESESSIVMENYKK